MLPYLHHEKPPGDKLLAPFNECCLKRASCVASVHEITVWLASSRQPVVETSEKNGKQEKQKGRTGKKKQATETTREE